MASQKLCSTQTFPPRAQRVALGGENSEPLGAALRLDFGRGAAVSALGDIIVRTGRLVSIFAASLIALAPLHAMAQTALDEQDRVAVRDRPRPDYDALGMRLGGFDLNAYVDLSATRTDNLFATETNEIDDTIYSIAPYAQLASRWSRHALVFSGGANFRSHADVSTEDSETGFVRADGRLDIGSNSNITAGAGWAREVLSRTDPDALVFGEPIESERTDYILGASHQFTRFRLSGAIGHIDYDYDAPQDIRDSSEDNLQGRIDVEVTPRIAAFGLVRFDERDYDNSPQTSSEGRTYLAGVSIDFSELMRGEIGVGQFEREYNSGVSSDGIALSADLEWYVTRLTTISLNANRTGEDAGNGVANISPYTETEYGARVDHELLRNLIVSLGAQNGRREYEVLNREDDYTTVAAEAEYLMNRRVSLRGRVAQIDYESSGADAPPLRRSFDATEVTLGLRLKL